MCVCVCVSFVIVGDLFARKPTELRAEEQAPNKKILMQKKKPIPLTNPPMIVWVTLSCDENTFC